MLPFPMKRTRGAVLLARMLMALQRVLSTTAWASYLMETSAGLQGSDPDGRLCTSPGLTVEAARRC